MGIPPGTSYRIPPGITSRIPTIMSSGIVFSGTPFWISVEISSRYVKLKVNLNTMKTIRTRHNRDHVEIFLKFFFHYNKVNLGRNSWRIPGDFEKSRKESLDLPKGILEEVSGGFPAETL